MTDATRNLLEQHFDTAFAALDGVARLREFILTLAMQGKLVEQDPNDPPARELLKEIEVEKQRLVRAGKIKRPKSLPPIKPEEVPYELPQGWEWGRLGHLIDITMGQAPLGKDCNTDGNGMPFVKVGQFGPLRPHIEEWTTNPQKMVTSDHVLICVVGATIGRINLDTDCAIGRSVAGLLPEALALDKLPLFDFLKTWVGKFRDSARGSAQGVISKEHLNEVCFPLPPLPEQHRIVARIDQLMVLCDTLDQQIDAATGKQAEVLGAVMAQV